jgi:hypothetical protein
MPMLVIFILLLALFGLLLLFVAAVTPQRVLTVHFPAAHSLECASVGHANHHTAECLRIPHFSRKRWRRTPGMQSGLPPPTTLAGRGLSACSNALRAAGVVVSMGTQAPAHYSWFGVT